MSGEHLIYNEWIYIYIRIWDSAALDVDRNGLNPIFLNLYLFPLSGEGGRGLIYFPVCYFFGEGHTNR